jgi:hypothetical protein
MAPPAARAEECPNTAFRTGASAALPDCRAYELVTPPFKNSGYPYFEAYSPDGSSGRLDMDAALPDSESFSAAGLRGPEIQYSLDRTASGWTTVSDELPASEYKPLITDYIPYPFQGASLDGLTTVSIDRGVSQPENSLNIFKRLPDGSIVEVGPGLPPSAPSGTVAEVGGASDIDAVGVSSDASHVLFTLIGDRWPFDGTESGTSLYEYAGTGNTTPLLVGVNQSGALISKCGTVLGGSRHGHNSMSMNAQTIFFTALCGARTKDELYARIDNGEPNARTVDISEPSKEDCEACDTEADALQGAEFLGASEDGSKVFFSTGQPLLGGNPGAGIYEYDFDAPAGERIVRATAPNAEVTSQPVISEDGSHLYFLAHGVLTTTANGEGETAEAGANNLYMFERDASYPAGRTAFVARLSIEDQELWETAERAGADVTPTGGFLVFASERDLTPDDTSKSVRQLFEYDAQTGILTRVSIGQDGFNNNGNVPPVLTLPGDRAVFTDADNAEFVRPFYFAGHYNPAAYSSGLSVSANGSYVFFQSAAGLTPQAFDRTLLDTYLNNGNPVNVYANNVYEYHDGRVSLISDGHDANYHPTYYVAEGSLVQLLGTDESGADVLFTTADQLVGQDIDTETDIYDARIDGGFPAPSAATECAGESCEGPLSGVPTLLSPGSEFQAGGNPPLAAPAASKPVVKHKAKIKQCKRGTTLKHGKCVKAKVKKAGNKRGAKP